MSTIKIFQRSDKVVPFKFVSQGLLIQQIATSLPFFGNSVFVIQDD